MFELNTFVLYFRLRNDKRFPAAAATPRQLKSRLKGLPRAEYISRTNRVMIIGCQQCHMKLTEGTNRKKKKVTPICFTCNLSCT